MQESVERTGAKADVAAAMHRWHQDRPATHHGLVRHSNSKALTRLFASKSQRFGAPAAGAGRLGRRTLTSSHYRWPLNPPNTTHVLRRQTAYDTRESDLPLLLQTQPDATGEPAEYKPRYTKDTISQLLFKAVQTVQECSDADVTPSPNAPVLCSAFEAAWSDRKSALWQHMKQALCHGDNGICSLDDAVAAVMSPSVLQWLLSKSVILPSEQLLDLLARLQSEPADQRGGYDEEPPDEPPWKHEKILLDVSELLHALLTFVHDVQNPIKDPNAAVKPPPPPAPEPAPVMEEEAAWGVAKEQLSIAARPSETPCVGPYHIGSVGHKVLHEKNNWSRHGWASNTSRTPRTAPAFAFNPETGFVTGSLPNIGPGLYTEGMQQFYANQQWGKHYIQRSKREKKFYRETWPRPEGLRKPSAPVDEGGVDGEHYVVVQGLSVTCGGSVQGNAYRQVRRELNAKAAFDRAKKLKEEKAEDRQFRCH